MLKLIFAFVISVFGAATILADCHLPHGSVLRIIPGATGIVAITIIIFILKKKGLKLNNVLLVTATLFVAAINLIAFFDWSTSIGNFRKDNIALYGSDIKVEINGVEHANLYFIDDDWHLLVIRIGDNYEFYHIHLEECIISFIPALNIGTIDEDRIEVNRSIIAGRRFVYDITTSCKTINGNHVMIVEKINNPDYFPEEPYLLHKELIFIR